MLVQWFEARKMYKNSYITKGSLNKTWNFIVKWQENCLTGKIWGEIVINWKPNCLMIQHYKNAMTKEVGLDQYLGCNTKCWRDLQIVKALPNALIDPYKASVRIFIFVRCRCKIVLAQVMHLSPVAVQLKFPSVFDRTTPCDLVSLIQLQIHIAAISH